MHGRVLDSMFNSNHPTNEQLLHSGDWLSISGLLSRATWDFIRIWKRRIVYITHSTPLISK